jgi:hypothetical protein
MDLRSERWSIRPLELPRPWRYCASCATRRAFVCSERFRVNAQKKSLDVWLNYRCESCEDVWKFPLLERRPVAELGPALDDFARHDRATVWKYAFDIARLRPHVIRVDTDVRVQIVRSPLAARGCSRASGIRLHRARRAVPVRPATRSAARRSVGDLARQVAALARAAGRATQARSRRSARLHAVEA